MSPSTSRLVLAAAAAYASVFGFARFAYSVMLPVMQEDLGASVSTMGVLGSANLAGYVIGSLLAMPLTERFRASRVNLSGLVSVCLGLGLMSTIRGPGQAALLMFVLGAGSALAFIATTVVVSNAMPERRGRLLGFATAGIGFGTTISSLIIAALLAVSGDGWRLSWLVLATALGASLPWIHRTIAGADLPARSEPRGVQSGWGLTRDAIARSRRMWVFPMYVCWGAGYITYVMFLTTFLHQERGLTTGAVALIYSIVGIAAIFGGPLVGPLHDRWTRSPLMATTLTICAAGTAMLLLAESVTLYVVSAILFGMPISAVGTLISAHVGDLWRASQQGPILSAVTVLFGVAQAATPAAVGLVTDRTGTLVPSFVFGIVVLLLGAVMSLALPGRPEMPV